MGVFERLAVAVALCVLWFAVGRGAAVVLTSRSDGANERWYGVYHGLKMTMVAVGLFGPVVLTNGTVLGLAGDGVPAVLAALVDAALGTAFATASVYALSLGQRPMTRVRRDRNLTRPGWFRRRWLASLVVPAALFALAYTLVLSGVVFVDLYWLSLALVLAILVKGIVGMPTGQASNTTAAPTAVRDPTDEERELIERCYRRFDRAPGWIQVFTREDSTPAFGRVNGAGSGDQRSVWIQEEALEAWSEDELAVALAHVSVRVRRRYYQTVLLWLSPYVAILSLVGSVSMYGHFVDMSAPVGLAAILVCAVLTVVLARRCRRIVNAGDEFALEHFEAKTVRSTIERIGPEIGQNPSQGVPGKGVLGLETFFDIVSPLPRIETRLGRFSADTSPADVDPAR